MPKVNENIEDASAFDSKTFLKHVTQQPGVYLMKSTGDDVLYVGKAKNLKKRLSSYFTRAHNDKTLALVSQIQNIEINITQNEAEALLLEDNLIKKHQPRYNILLRDDKSYPYIHITTQQEFPRIKVFRGNTKNKPGLFFGPYPAATAVRQTIHWLHKIFRLRQCNDSYFKNRSRPCLQYQIKRCSGPCVGLISQQEYTQAIQNAERFLSGHAQMVIDELATNMEQESGKQEYERAASYRDQIAQLRQVLEKQYVSGMDITDTDVLACVKRGQQACVQIFYYRNGMSQGSQSFFPKLPDPEVEEREIMQAFISQYYLSRQIPGDILVTHTPADVSLLMNILSDRAGHKVSIRDKVRKQRAQWLKIARENAKTSLHLHTATRSQYQEQLTAIQSLFKLDNLPTRIECFDISHTQGQETVASCVVFNESGAVKSDYRRFNITDITPGDDYAAMSQVLRRRYQRVLNEDGHLPDVILIDGGKGQLNTALQILEPIFAEPPCIVAISKGPDRQAGMEMLHMAGQKHPIEASSNPSASLLLQNIRDEAHRFAITAHRNRARKKITQSGLEAIEGLGPKRKQLLLKSFGGIHGIKRAGVDDLSSIKGISKQLATRIFEYFHPEQST